MALTTMRASVGCIPNTIPEGFSRKSLRTTAEEERAGVVAGTIAVTKSKRAAGIKACSLSRWARRRATPW